GVLVQSLIYTLFVRRGPWCECCRFEGLHALLLCLITLRECGRFPRLQIRGPARPITLSLLPECVHVRLLRCTFEGLHALLLLVVRSSPWTVRTYPLQIRRPARPITLADTRASRQSSHAWLQIRGPARPITLSCPRSIAIR